MKFSKRWLLAPLALAVAVIGIAATQFATIVSTRAQLGTYTSSQAGPLSFALVYEAGHFGFYQYNPSSNATADGNSVIEPSDSPATGRWLLVSGILGPGTVTFNIASSGGDFTSFTAAQSAIKAYAIASGTSIVLQGACGQTFTSATPFFATWRAGIDFAIQGCAATTYAITGVASASGSAGAWSYTFTTAGSTASLVAGNDYVIVYGAANGTNPTRADGPCFVTATGSNQFTCTNYQQVAAAASGAVTASADRVGTVWKTSGADGIDVWGWSNIDVQNIALIGDGTSHNGLSLQDNGRVHSAGDLIIGGFGNYEYDVILNAEFNWNPSPIASFGGVVGMQVFDGGSVQASSPAILVGASSEGLNIQNGGAADFVFVGTTTELFALGSIGDGVSCSNGGVFYGQAILNDNGGYGFDDKQRCIQSLQSSTESGNALGSCFPNTSNCNYFNSPGVALAGPINFSTGTPASVLYNQSGTNPVEWQSSWGWWLTGGQSIDICGSYTNVGANWLRLCGSLQLSALTTAGILVNNTSGTVSNDTAGVACSGSPSASFATDSHGVVTHC